MHLRGRNKHIALRVCFIQKQIQDGLINVKQCPTALADNMHLRGRNKHIDLRVCFIQKLIQDGLINVKQCPTAAQIADIGTKALSLVPFKTLTDQLLGDKHVGDK